MKGRKGSTKMRKVREEVTRAGIGVEHPDRVPKKLRDKSKYTGDGRRKRRA